MTCPHGYRQVEASDEVRDGDPDRDPLGEDKTLGNAIDLILAYREIPGLRLELVSRAMARSSAALTSSRNFTAADIAIPPNGTKGNRITGRPRRRSTFYESCV